MIELPLPLKKIVDEAIEIEVGGSADPGGYTNDPADPGGETRWGVTIDVARANGWAGRMSEYPREHAFDVFAQKYIIKPGFYRVAQRSLMIANELTEAGINLGIRKPSRWLQDSLNLFNYNERHYPDTLDDGWIGDETLRRLDDYLSHRRHDDGAYVMTLNLNHLQGAEYNRLAKGNPTFERFIYGWVSQRTKVVEIPGKINDLQLQVAAA